MRATRLDYVQQNPQKSKFPPLLNLVLNAVPRTARRGLAPEAYRRLGARPPKGVLLYGPPGTGKTTLVKAVCAEGVYSFIYVDCASVLSAYVGEAEQRLRDVFARARAQSPCLVFFDEVDAVSGRRDGGGSGGESDTAKLLSTLLIEMDGFAGGDGGGPSSSSAAAEVCFVGATNLPHRVDSALLRPGRFDLLVHVPLPDAAERYAILRALLLRNYDTEVHVPSSKKREEEGKGSEGERRNHLRSAEAQRLSVAVASASALLRNADLAPGLVGERNAECGVSLTPDDALALLTSAFSTAAATTATSVNEGDAASLVPPPLSLHTISHCVDVRYLLGDVLPCAFEDVRRLAGAEGAEGKDSSEGTDGAIASPLPPPPQACRCHSSDGPRCPRGRTAAGRTSPPS